MTTNQIAYWKALEEKRSNIATETETNRANVAKELETARNNQAVLNENQRHNKAVEKYNSDYLSELHRSNLSNEEIKRAQNKLQEASLAESARHNAALESIDVERNAIQRSYNDAMIIIGLRNAASNERNAASNAINASANERNAASNALNASANWKLATSGAALQGAQTTYYLYSGELQQAKVGETLANIDYLGMKTLGASADIALTKAKVSNVQADTKLKGAQVYESYSKTFNNVVTPIMGRSGLLGTIGNVISLFQK